MANRTIKRYIGLKLDYANKLAEKEGLTIRLVKKDGIPFIIARDYHLDRINFTVENDKVVGAHIG